MPRRSMQRLVPVVASTLAVIMVLGLATGASVAQQPQASSDYQLFVPLVSRGPSVLFSDNFEGGTGNWTPYLQWKHLEPGQWYWDADGGYGGSAGYTFHFSAHGATKYAEDAMTMMLGQGSEGWTDYRLRSKLNVRSGDRVGLWVRGTYKQSDNNGQWFTGYYCVITARHVHDRDKIHLLQMRTEDEPSTTPPEKPWNLYHFANPKELVSRDLDLDLRHDRWYEMVVEVRGPHITCYIQDAAGASSPESVQANSVEYNDTVKSVFLTGTIGFKVYGTDGGFAALTYDDVIVEPLD